MIFQRLSLLLLSLGLAACMSTQVQLDSRWNPTAKPSYEDYFDYYFLGLKGDRQFSLQKVCMDQRPFGFRRYRSLEDSFLTAITLGIYAPMTVQVWCGNS